MIFTDMDVTVITHDLLGAAVLALGDSGINNDQIALIVVIGGVTTLMLIMTRRRMRKAHNSPQAYVREQRTRIRDEETLVQNIETLMAQLEAVTRETSARLDTKFAKLEAVIRDADERSDRLERQLRQSGGIATLDLVVDNQTEQAGAAPKSSAPTDDRRQAIFRLDEAGLTAGQIAGEIGQSQGEVELILALHKAAQSAAS